MPIYKQVQLGAVPRNVITTINNNFNKLTIPTNTLTTQKIGDIERGTDLSTLPINTILTKLLTSPNGFVSKAAITDALGGKDMVTGDKVGVANGVAQLDATGKLKDSQLPETISNSTKLNGKDASYYATADALATKASELENRITSAMNSMQWRPSVANIAAMKAITHPQEGWTLSVDDTNQVYRFDVQTTKTADEADKYIIATDGTAGSWVKLGTTVYSAASTTADGLMSKEDKGKLDTLVGTDVPAIKQAQNDLKAKFDTNGAALNAVKLGGKPLADFVTTAQLNAITGGAFVIKSKYIPHGSFTAGYTFSTDPEAPTYSSYTLPAGDTPAYRLPLSALRKNDDGTFEYFIPVISLSANGQDVTVLLEEPADTVLVYAEIKAGEGIQSPTSPDPAI